MSKSEILYVKGMNISESEGDDDDPWDDKKLNDAYDKAVRIANVEVAKRVAMSTNTPSTTTEPVFFSKKDKSSTKSYSAKKKESAQNMNHNVKTNETLKEIKWKPGMPCRLVYMEDGMEYEAVFIRSIENDECIVKYLGYETQEIVQIDVLKPSMGKEARTRQIKEARREQTEDSFDSQSPNLEAMETSDRVMSPDSVDRSSQRRKKSSKKKKNQSRHFHVTGGFDLPEMPPMPNLSMLRNLGTGEMPMPPPPMNFSSLDRSDSEEQAISSMLLSWYMSGYYTGLYQGLKRAKESRRNI
ncbi:survival motor neuron protein isoform X2 [Trichoplusia ni]|uniref:Survival motor neuron protein isoform X2 n=1 Tax=Trichoplusia ni TaxID=7111 RepID=A0A7E5VH74_TRINI|nr:survival motor neuron protein isoform X2 [Trichoplusia ni]